MTTQIPWDAPAKAYHRISLPGGRPRERADFAGTLRQCVIHVRSGSAGPIDKLAIVLDDKSVDIAGYQIQGLIDQL